MKRRRATRGRDPPRNSGVRRVDETCKVKPVTSPLLAMPGLRCLGFRGSPHGEAAVATSGRTVRDAAAPWQRASSAPLHTEPVLGRLALPGFFRGRALRLFPSCRDFVLMELDSLQAAGPDHRSRRKCRCLPVPGAGTAAVLSGFLPSTTEARSSSRHLCALHEAVRNRRRYGQRSTGTGRRGVSRRRTDRRAGSSSFSKTRRGRWEMVAVSSVI